MKCTPKIEDRIRGIVRATAFCNWLFGMVTLMVYATFGGSMAAALVQLSLITFCIFLAVISFVLFTGWFTGNINFCGRTSDDKEDVTEYDHML